MTSRSVASYRREGCTVRNRGHTISSAYLHHENHSAKEDTRPIVRTSPNQVVATERERRIYNFRIRLPPVTTIDEIWESAKREIVEVARPEN
ncbi:hypothetical protein Y032_0120g886 [Ancylostoma ceylanicum]|uniref:Uncharacterized protein n=1 Tax=Ancylostoma ceylanicum TaxID=53326 RepID=A0A016TAG7_9BILA|nr:hypothetical protein Y032_0120g886 [Ancylostoma ceylanicum]